MHVHRMPNCFQFLTGVTGTFLPVRNWKQFGMRWVGVYIWECMNMPLYVSAHANRKMACRVRKMYVFQLLPAAAHISAVF